MPLLTTRLTRMLDIRHPILSVGFGTGAGPELAAAVSGAGALGVLGMSRLDPELIRRRITETRSLTDRPFGANVILHGLREGEIEGCLEERVPLLVLFWGDPSPYVPDVHRRGVRVAVQVGSVEEAVAAAEAGVDFIIAQGFESGGHVRGTTALSVLVPAVVEATRPVPVVASGGIADGAGLVAALGLGAEGVSMGTRFVASEEAHLRPEYKQRVVDGTAEDTVYSTDLFDGGWPDAPHRALRNRVVEEWEGVGRPPSGRRPAEGTSIGTYRRSDGTIVDVPRYTPFMATPEFEGDIELAPLWAGESCTLIREVKPAAQIVREVVEEAERLLRRLASGDGEGAGPRVRR